MAPTINDIGGNISPKSGIGVIKTNPILTRTIDST
jgi:hypothetical protein